MDNVSGLRPVGTPDNTLTRKRGRKLVNSRGSQERLRPTAAPVDTFVSSGLAPDVSSHLNQVSDALKSLNPMLERYALNRKADSKEAQAKQEKEQLQKLRYYTELFAKDKEAGAVSQAQVKEIFPELVPSVAARIAQATGEKESKEWLSTRIQSILENDELRLNTQAREVELQSIRTEATERIGENEFYGAGFLNQMDRSLSEFSTTWMRETAAYQEDLQKESLASEVSQVLDSGGDLLTTDQTWKDSSSLNHQERNAVILKTVIGKAVSTLNPQLLDQIPDRFLNATSKAELAKAKLDINNGMFTQYVQQQRLEDDKRKAVIREGKVEVLGKLSEGQAINPLDYRETPEVYQYASQLANQPSVNPVASQAEARRIRSALMMGATNGDFTQAIGGTFAVQLSNDQVNEQTLTDWISSAEGMNPAERIQLMKDLPVLMEGINFVRDPDFNTYFDDNIGSDAKVYANSAMGSVLSQSGFNVLGETRKAYNTSIRQSILQHIDEKGTIPRNRIDIMDKASEAAKQRLINIQRNATEISKQEFSKTAPQTQEVNASPVIGSPIDKEGYLTLPSGKKIKVTEKR